MKKIMVLAGGNDQVALIEELRRYLNGKVEILLVDMSDKVRAIPYADKFLPISTMDKEAVLKAAKEEKIDYILTACGDQPLSTMAYVSAQMGLPCYLTEEEVQNLTNKLYMKKMMVQNGIPTAKHISISKDWDKSLLNGFKYPLVVKPVDSNGSKGVKKVMDEDELENSLEEAFFYSLSGDAIIEEYKEGVELSVDVYVEDTTAKLLSVTTSRKIKQNTKSFTIVQSCYPAEVDYNENEVLAIAQKIVDVFGLKNTPLLVQMIQGKDELNVVEFSARMGGGSKYHLIKVLSGVDIMKVYVSMVMGEKPHVQPAKQVNTALMSYVYCYPGTYCKLGNFDELLASGGINDYFVYRLPVAEMTKSETSSDRVAGFLVVGDSWEDVNVKMAKANSKLQVLNKENQDIMRHDFY